MKRFQGKVVSCVVLSCLTAAIWAAPQAPLSGWVASAGLGYSDYPQGSDNSHFQVTTKEHDQLDQDDQHHRLNGLLSGRYFQALSQPWLSSIGGGISIAYHPARFEGDVEQFGSSALNNYDYDYDVKPINLMAEFDIGLPLLLKHRLQPFVLMGMGMSVMHLSLTETPKPNIREQTNQTTQKDSEWHARMMGELGLGAHYQVSSHWLLGLRYSYNVINDASVSLSGRHETIPIHPINQSLMATVSYRWH